MKKIVVTDSGLGGINVMANAYNQLKEYKTFPEVELIFFNALPDEGFGYNQLPTFAEKVRVFEKVLLSIEENYSPDNILIACNTLSVVYNSVDRKLQFSLPVTGILETGVNMIYDKLLSDLNSEVLIIGTPTTINSGQHKAELIKKGIDETRIRTQACLLLESVIQNDPESPEVLAKIDECLHPELSGFDKGKKLFLALCCTHYEYSTKLFEQFLFNMGILSEILNPNEKMLESFVIRQKNETTERANIQMKVVSKTKLKENDIQSVNRILTVKCPELKDILTNYEHRPELFTL